MKRLATYAVVILATLATLVLLWYFRTVVILFILSLFTGAAARPLIRRLEERGLSTGVAIILTYAFGLSIVALWAYIISQSIFREIQALLNAIANGYDILYTVWSDGTMFQQALAGRLPPPNRLYEAIAAEEGTVLAQALFTTLRSIATVLGSIGIVLVLSIYWSIDRARFERLWLSLLPAGQRHRARDIWRSVEEGVAAFIRSEVIQVFMAVLLLAIGYLLMDIDYPTLLALIGAVAWLIPIVGFVFAVIPAVVVGLSTSLTMAIVAGVFTLAVFLLLELFVEPRLFDRRQTYSSLAVVLLMIPLFDAYGFVGLLAASPLAVGIEILLIKMLGPRRMEVQAVYPSARIEELEERLEELQAAAPERQLSPELLNLLERLDTLLDKAGKAVSQETTGGAVPPPST
ncbi:MAG TPA: AI-2E family transporter [Candidatus Sulfomarinibacteraceae bacterium]|nr:AI-2E family transporter [Candidatus Sulfomarinibacteraceae bacterium]